MIFRKDCLLFCQSLTSFSILLALCFALIPFFGIKVTAILSTAIVVIAIVDLIHNNEYITVNEVGITCSKAGKQMWAYEWNTIAKLQRSSRYLLPSMEIFISSSEGEKGQSICTGNYFQLGRTAKKALDKYYKLRWLP